MITLLGLIMYFGGAVFFLGRWINDAFLRDQMQGPLWSDWVFGLGTTIFGFILVRVGTRGEKNGRSEDDDLG